MPRPSRRLPLVRTLAAGVLLLAATVALGGCDRASGTFTARQADTLTVITQSLPTYGFWEGTDERPTGGLEFAMAQELQRRFGLSRLVVRTASFSQIVAGQLGDADLAMTLITPTDERQKQLDFTTPYAQSPPALLTRAGTDVPDLQTAQKLRWVVGEDTTFQDIVETTILPKQPARTFGDRTYEIAAVRDGNADVAMFDLPAAQAIVNRDDRLAIAAKLADDEPIAAALPKGSSNTEAVSAAFRAMEADGTLDRLSKRWLGRSLTDLDADVPLLRTSEAP